MDTDTIVALSTPPGESGIAVVRISGSRALEILTALTHGYDMPSPYRVCRRVLRARDGAPLDDVLAVYLKAPHTYTGEHMVEISCHGGMRIVADIIDEVIGRGARAADAGEFTKRAFLNGRLDLSQAEAVADLIAAETQLQRRVALEHLEGGLSRKVGRIEEQLLEQLVAVEVSIDFSEEDISTYDPERVDAVSRGIVREITELVESEAAGRKLRSGIRITILGPRNAGKSSLYNVLLGEERAIVSSLPGTTRDILRERIHIGGFTYLLEDTAGIAETGCEVEAKGISIGRRAAELAGLVLFVIDGSESVSRETMDEVSRLDRAKTIVVLNKSDLGFSAGVGAVAEELGADRVAVVSALSGEGLDGLKRRIYAYTVEGETSEIERERIAVNARQAAALREALEAMKRLLEALAADAPAEIVSIEIRAAADACGKVTGRSIADDLLEEIFSRFCIGK